MFIKKFNQIRKEEKKKKKKRFREVWSIAWYMTAAARQWVTKGCPGTSLTPGVVTTFVLTTVHNV